MAAIFGEGKIFWKLQRVHCLDTLWVKNSVQIALSLTVSEILRFFRFSQKFKMAAKSGETYRILFYYPVSQKFCRNRSISYGFWDISKLLKSSTENTQWST